MRPLIPNAVTCLNLLLGFAAIIESGKGNLNTASALILLCVALDMLDGFLARHLNAVSRFGGELDSLADVVSFGAAPAAILYHQFFIDAGLPGLLISAAPLIATALRLARFNTSAKSSEFCGLPCPAAAILITSASGWLENGLAATALIAFCAILMISALPYPSSIPSKRAAITLTVFAAAVIILTPHPLFVLALSYVGTALIKSAAQSARRLTAPVRQLAPEWAVPAAETHRPANRI